MKFFVIGLGFFVSSLFLPLRSYAQIYIDVSSPQYKPLKIEIRGDLKDELTKLLSYIGYFEINEGGDILIKTKREREGFKVECESAITQKNIFTVSFDSTSKIETSLSLSNYILEKLVGIKTKIFGTQYIFISDRDGKKEIWSAIFPNLEIKKIIPTKSSIISASISPSGRKIAYVTYTTEGNNLVIADFDTKKIYSPISPRTLFSSPKFVSESEIVFGLSSKGEESSLYIFNIETRDMKRITSGSSDISGDIFNGKIVFSSGRFGNPFLFLKVGENEKKITKEYSSYPSFSPDGKYILYSKMEGNSFNIWIYDIEEDVEQPVIRGFGSSETPTWSPDGNFIIFSSNKDGNYDLYITDKKGSFIRKLISTPYKETNPSFPKNQTR